MTQECSHSFVYNGFRFSSYKKVQIRVSKVKAPYLELMSFNIFFFLFSFFFFLFLSRFIKVPYPGFVLLDRSRFIKKQWLHELCFFLVSVLHIKIIYDRNWNCNSNSKVRILNIKKNILNIFKGTRKIGIAIILHFKEMEGITIFKLGQTAF